MKEIFQDRKMLEDSVDLRILVEAFYSVAIEDSIIGLFFTKAVPLDLQTHIPTIVRFWESLLFDGTNYKDNPMIKHIALNQKMSLDKVHFDRWLALWDETVDRLFEGEKAEEAKQRAHQIALLMQVKIERSKS